MNDQEKIREIIAGIYARPNYYNGLYEAIQKATKVDLNWRPNSVFGANFLKKQVDKIDSLLKESIERGEDVRDKEVLARIGAGAVAQTSGVVFFVIILVVVIGLVLWSVVF